MPPRESNIRHMIHEINELGRRLTKWEEEFMIDITAQFEETSRVSPNQLEVLTRIYNDRV